MKNKKNEKILLGIACSSAILLMSMVAFSAINRTSLLDAKNNPKAVVESSSSMTGESTIEIPTTTDSSVDETVTTTDSVDESTTTEPSETTEPTETTEPSETEPTETSTSETTEPTETTETSTQDDETDVETKPSSSGTTEPSSSTRPSADMPSKPKPAPKPAIPPKNNGQVPQQNAGNSSSSNIVPAVGGSSSIWYAQNLTTKTFIDKIGNDARKIAWDNDLYASVMIAQAILESSSGNSQLACPPNYNLFGIKGEYQGQSVSMLTAEDNGRGGMFTIRASFRAYPNYTESLKDYAYLLTESNLSTYYQGALKTKASSYRGATKYLTGRYATDIKYATKLNGLIEAYKLTEFDQLQPESKAQSNQQNSKVKKKTIRSKYSINKGKVGNTDLSKDLTELIKFSSQLISTTHRYLFQNVENSDRQEVSMMSEDPKLIPATMKVSSK